MAKTVVGLFDTTDEANTVVTDLVNQGFNRNDISVVANDAAGKYKQTGTGTTTTGTTTASGNADGEDAADAAGSGAVSGTMVGGGLGLLVGLGALLIPGIGPVIAAGPIATVLGMTAAGAGIGAAAGGLIGALTHAGVPEDDANYYAEGVKRGGTLVMVAAPDDRAQTAYDVMQNHGAVDIDERAEDYRKEGFQKFDPNSQPYAPAQVQAYQQKYSTNRPAMATETTTTETRTTGMAQPQTQARQMNTGEEVLPVMQEELAVGKREVQRGGARIFTRVTEQPVEEQVQLREEQINIDRQPVNRAVTDADMAAFKDGVIELTETDEEAVVSKQARVVEEVRVGKEVTERTETIRDNVRRTDVEVEQIPAQQTATTTTNTVMTGTTTTGTTTSGFSSYDSDFRTHFQGLNRSGATYEQYTPVYQYGYNLANDQTYTGRDWSAIQGDVQQQWEAKNPNTWDQFKDSIHYAWDKARGAVSNATNRQNDASNLR